MDIRNWPIDRIMQLPDFCFGRRYMIVCSINQESGVQSWDISEIAFPEKAVIWEMTIEILGAFAFDDSFRIAIGHQLPTTTAQMSALDPLIPGMGIQGVEPRYQILQLYAGTSMRKLRMPIETGGRRMILEITPIGQKAMTVKIIVSSIPTEVPDWLISVSGLGSGLL